jgi:hypothetical protein
MSLLQDRLPPHLPPRRAGHRKFGSFANSAANILSGISRRYRRCRAERNSAKYEFFMFPANESADQTTGRYSRNKTNRFCSVRRGRQFIAD